MEPIPVLLRNVDCLDRRVGIWSLPHHSVDLAIIDPPYAVTMNAWDVRLDPVTLFAALEHAVKPTGVVILFAQGRFTAELMTGPWAKHWRYNLVWSKNKSRGFFHAARMPLRSHEDVVVFYRQASREAYTPQMDAPRTMARGGGNPRNRTAQGVNYYAPRDNRSPRYGAADRYPTSVLPYAVVNETQCQHPTQKPLALLEFLVRSYSREHETVLDACMGSGSTGAAAVRNRRAFAGFELDPDYFAIARRRVCTGHWAPGRVRIVNAITRLPAPAGTPETLPPLRRVEEDEDELPAHK